MSIPERRFILVEAESFDPHNKTGVGTVEGRVKECLSTHPTASLKADATDITVFNQAGVDLDDVAGVFDDALTQQGALPPAECELNREHIQGIRKDVLRALAFGSVNERACTVDLIVVRDSSGYGEMPWVQGAWDSFTIDENPAGWQEAIQKAQEAHGAENVRIIRLAMPERALSGAFDIPVFDSSTVPTK